MCASKNAGRVGSISAWYDRESVGRESGAVGGQVEGGLGGRKNVNKAAMEARELLDFVNAEDAECFKHLPAGWRLELVLERIDQQPGYDCRLYYFSPDGLGPFCNSDEVAAHLSSPPYGNWQHSGSPPAVRHLRPGGILYVRRKSNDINLGNL